MHVSTNLTNGLPAAPDIARFPRAKLDLDQGDASGADHSLIAQEEWIARI
jgi:hypothetical protein